MTTETATKNFYDQYWPQNVPDYQKTSKYVMETVDGHYEYAFDGGCGTGVCTVALAALADRVVSFDISGTCLETTKKLAFDCGVQNIEFKQGSLLNIDFPDDVFDLVWCWGVIHHTENPLKALDELVRILRPGGILVLAVYLKTNLTWLHESARKICLAMDARSNWFKPFVLRTGEVIVRILERLGKKNNVRDDNKQIKSQVEDWFFVPIKHFFTIDEMRRHFTNRGLIFELICSQTGRLKSSSNFVVRGKKQQRKEYQI